MCLLVICDGQVCHSNSASAALNKWMKSTIGNGYVVHGLRHSLRDCLRAVECPPDIIDAIGGCTTTGIGHAYGKGYGVDILAKWCPGAELCSSHMHLRVQLHKHYRQFTD